MDDDDIIDLGIEEQEDWLLTPMKPSIKSPGISTSQSTPSLQSTQGEITTARTSFDEDLLTNSETNQGNQAEWLYSLSGSSAATGTVSVDESEGWIRTLEDPVSISQKLLDMLKEDEENFSLTNSAEQKSFEIISEEDVMKEVEEDLNRNMKKPETALDLAAALSSVSIDDKEPLPQVPASLESNPQENQANLLPEDEKLKEQQEEQQPQEQSQEQQSQEQPQEGPSLQSEERSTNAQDNFLQTNPISEEIIQSEPFIHETPSKRNQKILQQETDGSQAPHVEETEFLEPSAPLFSSPAPQTPSKLPPKNSEPVTPVGQMISLSTPSSQTPKTPSPMLNSILAKLPDGAALPPSRIPRPVTGSTRRERY